MELVPFQTFSNVTETLWIDGLLITPEHRLHSTGGQNLLPDPKRAPGTFFVGSEDPEVIQEAIEWGNRTGWKVCMLCG